MMSTLSKQELEVAFGNWLRSAKAFKAVEFSLAKDPEQFSLRKTKVQDFQTRGTKPVWEYHADRRAYLAKVLADTVVQNKLVKLEVNKDGVYIYQDVQDKFSPTRKAGSDDVSDTVAKGDDMPNESWEPYIKFEL